MRRMLWMCVALVCASVQAQSVDPQALVREVVKNEVQAQMHPQPRWSYTLEKTNASGTKVTRIVETRDGLVGRLLEINGKPLDEVTERNEEHRLNELRRDPSQLRQKLVRQERDRDRVLKIVRALPDALLYSDVSTEQGGKVRVLSFRPNPQYQPNSFETTILKAMSGTVRIAVGPKRLISLNGRLLSDVNIGLGIVGKVQKDGTLDLEETDLGDGIWEISRVSLMVMARAVFKRLDLSVEENLRDFKRLPHELSGTEAIDLLLRNPQM